MLADAVKATSSTSGTGALTLANVTNFVPPGTAFPLNFPFKYAIYTGGDSAPAFRESGIAYMTSATSMTRAKVSATSNGSGSLNTASGQTPTDFAGAAITVICAPDASSMESMLATVDSVSSSINRLLTSAARNGVTTTQVLTALRAYYIPFLLRCAAPITALAIHVGTAAASSVARAGIYACNENGYPGALLATTGDIDVTTTGLKQQSLSSVITLPPGWYFTAVVSNGAPSLVAYTSSTANMYGGHPVGFDSTSTFVPIDLRYESLGSAILASSASASTTALRTGLAHLPLVAMGVA